MKLQAKIERQYEKWCKLAELDGTEENDRKLDAAYVKLRNMFDNPLDFNAYWRSKIKSTITINTK